MIKRIFLGPLILLISYLIFSSSFLFFTLAQETRLYVDPPDITGLEIDDYFQINVTVSDVIDLYAWEFRLYYQNAILNATSIVEGPFLQTHPDPSASVFFTNPNFTDSYNATHGLIRAAATLIGVDEGVSGTGALATITLKVKGQRDCLLTLGETKLVDSAEPFGNLIPHITADGIVHGAVHDVAVINTETSKTVTNDTTVYINVTIENQGQAAETFNVTAYYNSTPIETKTITNLLESTSTVITFTWDTTPVPKGNYTITTTASTLPGETDTADNNHIDGWVVETIAGDVTGNYKVDILDIATIAKAYGAYPGHPKWNPNADLDNNSIINILDIAKAAKNYGKKI